MRERDKSGDPVLLEHSDQVAELAQTCRTEGRFAFDTEFVMEDRYDTELCLVQIATQRVTALIDPYLELDLSPVWSLMSDRSVEKVVHAGQEDLSICHQHTGQVPQNVFDVQIAAGLAGFEYPISLQKLIQGELHIRLHKAKTLTNWRKRPLAASQLGYAAEDVNHLLAVRDRLRSRLERLGRAHWVTEECRKFEAPSYYRSADEEKLLRLKGMGALRGGELAILREVLAWRDAIGQDRNRPPRSVIKDHIIVEIARLGINSFNEIRDLRGVNLSDRDVHGLCQLLKQAGSIPPEQWPQSEPRVIDTPEETTLVTLLTSVLRGFSAANAVAYGLIATKRSLLELVRRYLGGPQEAVPELLQGWRGEAVGALLSEILEGRSVIAVSLQGSDGILRIERRSARDRG